MLKYQNYSSFMRNVSRNVHTPKKEKKKKKENLLSQHPLSGRDAVDPFFTNLCLLYLFVKNLSLECHLQFKKCNKF